MAGPHNRWGIAGVGGVAAFGLAISLASVAALAGPAGHVFPVSDPTQPASIPSSYQSTYSTLQSQVAAFAASPGASTGPASSNMIVSSGLEPADGNTMAPGVLQTGALSNSERMVQQMKTMGDTGVTVQVGFPLLVTSFSDSAEYTSFYQQLAQYIHGQSMTLTVEENPLFGNLSPLPVAAFFQSLTLQSYIADTQQEAQTIINDMAPAYLVVLAEPDTYTFNLNNPSINLNNSVTAVQFVSGVLNGLNRNGTKVGAGTGTWQDGSEDQALINGSSIDFLDMHTYPIASSDLANMQSQTAEAAAANLPIVMSECWLYKNSTDGLPYNKNDIGGSSTAELKLVTFGFWEPLDQQFMTAMFNYARNNNFAVISPFATENFFAYQTWTSTLDSESTAQVIAAFDQVVSAARNAGVVSNLGGTLQSLNALTSGTTTTIPSTSTTVPPAGSAGYWMLDSAGTVYPFGSSAGHFGSPGAAANPWVAIAATPGGAGYWTVTSAGRVEGFGNATTYILRGNPLPPVVAIASTTDGKGYWLATSSGQVLPAGDAVSYGSPAQSGLALAKGIVNMVPIPEGGGYWLLGGDGGVFAYGDAAFYGSTGNIHLNAPAVAMAATADGKGYWIVASDGGVFSFGDAGFFGSMGAVHLNKPVNGMVATADGKGYWIVASDGGVFAFGDAGFVGSLGATPPVNPIVAFAPA